MLGSVAVGSGVDVVVAVGVVDGVVVGVFVRVAVAVGDAVLVGDAVAVGEGLGYDDSYAPISHPACCGRVVPRWSMAGQSVPLLLPVSIAGLPESRAWVCVDPPLFANGPSCGS